MPKYSPMNGWEKHYNISMKVILYMAISVDGFIAKPDHETPWSDAEFESYSSKVKETGNLIMGKTTYDLMLEENAFADLNEPFLVVLTSSEEKPTHENTVFVKDFQEALNILEQKGFETAFVGGGGKLNSVALESGLLEEIFVDVEPFIFGKGIPLFESTDIDLKLELIETKKIGDSGVQLHYKVLR